MLNEHTLPPLSGGKPRHAVILVHGLGDSGAGLIGLGEVWRQALPDTEFLAPDAPFPCDMAPFGYQWFSLDEVVPFPAMAQAERGLRQAGVQVATHACPNLGHSIDDTGLDIGLAFLRDAFQWESVA